MGEGEGGMIWENSTEIYTLPYAKQTANGNLMYDTGTQSWCSVTTWRDEVGKEVGGCLKGRGQMYTYDWFMLMYGKIHHNIVK